MNDQLGAVLAALDTEIALVFASHHGGVPQALHTELTTLIWRARSDPAAFVAEREAKQMAAITRGAPKKGPTQIEAAWADAIAKARGAAGQ